MLQPELEQSLTASPQYPLRIRQATRTLFRGSIQSARRRSSAKGYSVRYTRTRASCSLNPQAIPTDTVDSTHRAACDYTTAFCIKHYSIPRRYIPLTRPSQHLLATPTYTCPCVYPSAIVGHTQPSADSSDQQGLIQITSLAAVTSSSCQDEGFQTESGKHLFHHILCVRSLG